MPLTPHTLPQKYAPPPKKKYTHAPPLYTFSIIIFNHKFSHSYDNNSLFFSIKEAGR